MISIIIPTYNSATVIKRCLDSIIAQTYKDYEVLVMDGESKDDTIQIVNSYKNHRFKVYSEPDKGIYDAMNKGIDKSSGEWLLFLGSDDFLYNNEVLSNVTTYLSDNLDIVYGEVESELPIIHKGEWTLNKLQANRCHQAIFYSRGYFGNEIRYNLKYKILADYEMNLKWFLQPDIYKYVYIPITIAHFSTNGVSSCTHDSLFYEDYENMILNYGNRALPPKYIKRCYIGLENKEIHIAHKIKFMFLRRYYYCLQKIEEKLGIDQDSFRNICQNAGVK